MPSVWPSSPGLRYGPKVGTCALLVMLVLAGCGAGGGRDALHDRAGPAIAENGVTVAQYCEQFARQYSEDYAFVYEEGSVRLKRRSDLPLKLKNVFQPPRERFAGAFTCRFRIHATDDSARDVSLEIVLTNTRRFAEFIEWEDEQIIPIEYVHDPDNDKRGYGVFQYLDVS